MSAAQNQSGEACPACGSPLFVKQVEKLLRGGADTASVKVQAEVCERCGERLYDSATIQLFEEIRSKLAHRQTSEFVPLGQSFEVVSPVTFTK